MTLTLGVTEKIPTGKQVGWAGIDLANVTVTERAERVVEDDGDTGRKIGGKEKKKRK